MMYTMQDHPKVKRLGQRLLPEIVQNQVKIINPIKVQRKNVIRIEVSIMVINEKIALPDQAVIQVLEANLLETEAEQAVVLEVPLEKGAPLEVLQEAATEVGKVLVAVLEVVDQEVALVAKCLAQREVAQVLLDHDQVQEVVASVDLDN